MKTLAVIFLSLFFAKSCDGQKQDLSSAVVEYTASTRGYYRQVSLTSEKVSVNADRDGKAAPIVVNLTDRDKQEFQKLFENLDIEAIPTYKSPTEKRFYDGAAAAQLVVIIGDKRYESQAFDHRDAPAELEAFVNKIISFIPNK